MGVKWQGGQLVIQRSSWSSLCLVDKITSIAQMLAMLSLFPTVLFSYLSWNEAKLARQESLKIFLAEKYPNVTQNLTFVGDELRLNMKNDGDTIAKGIRVRMYVIPKIRKATFDTNEGYAAFRSMTIKPSSEMNIDLINRKYFSQIFSIPPAKVKKYDSVIDDGKDISDFVHIVIEYEDIAGDKYSEVGKYVMFKNAT